MALPTRTSSDANASADINSLQNQVAPTAYTTSGTDQSLNQPLETTDTAANLVPINDETSGAWLWVGTHEWNNTDVPGTTSVYTSGGGAADAWGSIYFSTEGGNYLTFAASSNNGLQTFTFGGSQGSFQYYYDRDAWYNALYNTQFDIHIAQNGDVFAATFSDPTLKPEKLIVDHNGKWGPAALKPINDNQPNTPYNIILDGDFNHNQAGGTGRATDGYIIDMWAQFNLGGVGTLTSTVTSEFDSDIKKNKLVFDLSSSKFWIYERLVGAHRHQTKRVSFFVEISSTSGINNIECGVSQNFGSGGSATVNTASSTQNIPASTSNTWYRFDVTVPSISGKTIGADNYFQAFIRTGTAQTTDITIHKIRLIETPTNLDDSIIPAWVKQEEDACKTVLLVNAYYWRISGDTTPVGVGSVLSTSSTKLVIQYPVEMVKAPTLDKNAVTDVTVFSATSTENSTGIATGVTKTKTHSLTITTAANLTAGESAHVDINGGSAYLDFDSRF